MRWASEGRVAVVAFTAAALRVTEASAADEDPSRGRVDGDVSVAVGAGIAVASSGARAGADLRARYLETAGVFATYEDGAVIGAKVDPVRVVAAGLEVRPLFLFRWLKGFETSRARFDLAVDSMGLELGAVFSQPAGAAFASVAGLQAGAGVELPMLPSATGPWIELHGGVRWSDDALGSGEVHGPVDRSAYLVVTLAWHQVFTVHVVDVGDRAAY